MIGVIAQPLGIGRGDQKRIERPSIPIATGKKAIASQALIQPTKRKKRI